MEERGEKGEKEKKKKAQVFNSGVLKVPLFVFLAEQQSIWHPSLEGGPTAKTLGLALSMLLLRGRPNSQQGPPVPTPCSGRARLQPASIKSLSSPTC